MKSLFTSFHYFLKKQNDRETSGSNLIEQPRSLMTKPILLETDFYQAGTMPTKNLKPIECFFPITNYKIAISNTRIVELK
jgi:hypothetical protein